MSKTDYPAEISQDMFSFVQKDDALHDAKLATKPAGYLKDAFRRFTKDKGAVAGAIIILFLLLFALFGPLIGSNGYAETINDTNYLFFTKLLPKTSGFAWAGWDGCKDTTVNQDKYNILNAIGVETGLNPVAKINKDAYKDVDGKTYYDIRLDSYYELGMIYRDLTYDQYKAIQDWQNETGIQVIYPAVVTSSYAENSFKNNANYWYKIDKFGNPILNRDGTYQDLYRTYGSDDYDSIRVESDPYNSGDVAGAYRYAIRGGSSDAVSYRVRICKYNWFQYLYGHKPEFWFGTDQFGEDIFTRLGEGARFSFMLAIGVSVITLLLGIIYGAIEGYFGGVVDMAMERIVDILNGIPFMIVTTLFQLHLAKDVGVVPALLLAFVATGWIGTAGTVRMQFYRYKNREYVLAARTLGASDWRLMFKHIFPNSLGTLVTSSVLIIPGVIFSESSLTYLGIVNLESSTMTSIGTMLAHGKDFLATFPHIILFPAIFIALLEISFNLFGNGLRDAFNPTLRGAEG